MRKPAYLIAFAACMLSACAGGPSGSLVRTSSPAQAAFEQQHLQAATREESEGDLAQAAWHWEVLAVLRPDKATYADHLTQTRARIAQEVVSRLRAARQAQQKGLTAEAMQRYLAVMALQPDHEEAAEALRALERERVRKEQLGRYSSRLLQPRMTAPATSKP
ncbi:MAG: hypothetical protein QM742_16655 [Aquabacterium sp.]